MISVTTPQGGFTLIEALVAISILTIAIVAPMTIAARGLQTAFYAKEQLAATHLAQEGAELVRMKRDEYALAHAGSDTDDWLDEVLPSCMTASKCGIDVRDFTFISCATESDCRLRYDADDIESAERGMYTYEATEYSPYTRTIRLSEVVSGSNEVAVKVEVSWTSGLWGGERSVILETRLFDHYDKY